MKHFRTRMTLVFLVACGLTLSAQEIAGQWTGTLQLPMGKLRIVFHISSKEGAYSATMDSPDQGVKDIPVTTTLFSEGTLLLKVAAIHAEYKGKMTEKQLKGTFTQSGQQMNLDLTKSDGAITVNRPQEPKAPYPYPCEEVTFSNKKANITLAGTLTLPQTGSNFPVAILITGSGPQDRNEELFGHKPFLVIADYLTRNGIAVLRYDDRGVGKSSGNFSTSTLQDFADDAASAIKYLQTRKEIDPQKIGLIGHSEGGIVAPMVAASSKNVHFIVLLAGLGMPGDELILLQKKLTEEHMGYNQAQVKESQEIMAGAYRIIMGKKMSPATVEKEVYDYFKTSSKDQASESQLSEVSKQITSPWFISFLHTTPATYLGKVKCPILALNGTKDLQVPCKENLSGITKSVTQEGINKQLTTTELENLNHLFQECSTGLPQEYGTIEETFSPKALVLIKDWIKEHTK